MKVETDTVDESMEELAEVYVKSKMWAKARGYGDVHLVKTHYKELKDGIWKDCWNIVWDNDEGRIAFMDECVGISSYKLGTIENGIQWHKVIDGKLPELDEKVLVITSANDDIPMVARRHIYTCYGQTEWEWQCYWGSGFDLKQNKIFAWCEIPKFEG